MENLITDPRTSAIMRQLLPERTMCDVAGSTIRLIKGKLPLHANESMWLQSFAHCK